MKPHYNVAAAVIENKGEILCVQRGKTKYDYTSYKYEFPGGKIEKGETPEQALKRELIEELKYDINIHQFIGNLEFTYEDFSVTLYFFHCPSNDRDITLTEHINAQWIERSKMSLLDWVEADKIFLRKFKF